ncbi:MAG: transposase [Candidatus Methylomirabilaceae bacterium]
MVGVKHSCELLGHLSRATHYRRQRSPVSGPRAPRPAPANALSAAERQQILDVCHEPRFADDAVPQIWSTTLDEGTYLASISTFYRVLRASGEVSERRAQATHPSRVRPELVAFAPNDVWSWDATKLRGPERGVWYVLLVMLDIYSRYAVHHQVLAGESADAAEAFIAEAIARAGVAPGAIHADRGSPMIAKPVAVLLRDLHIHRSHSRPRVSNDNPYSEAQFKTVKYCPEFPDRFGSLEDARGFSDTFMNSYNHHHRHSGIGLHTPASVYDGSAVAIRAHRTITLAAAYTAHPERFLRIPQPPKLPTAAWINRPEREVIQSR